MRKQSIVTGIASFFILLFAYAALSKFIEYDSFRFQLGKSPFLERFAGVLAWALPLGEIVVTAALFYKDTRLTGLFASLFLMSLFSVYIFSMLRFSYYTPCSCGGILANMGWDTHLYFNIFCVMIAVAAIFLHRPSVRVSHS